MTKPGYMAEGKKFKRGYGKAAPRKASLRYLIFFLYAIYPKLTQILMPMIPLLLIQFEESQSIVRRVLSQVVRRSLPLEMIQTGLALGNGARQAGKEDRREAGKRVMKVVKHMMF